MRINHRFTSALSMNILSDKPAVKPTPELFCRWSPDGTIIFANKNLCKYIGVSRAEILGRPLLDVLSNDALKDALARVNEFSEERPELFYDVKISAPDRTATWQQWITCALFTDDGKVAALQSVGRDITALKNAEEKIARINRLYSVLSSVNEAILRTKEIHELYERVCQIAIEEGRFQMAWVGLLNEESQLVEPVAHDGIVNGYLDNIKISIAEDPNGRGPTGNAIRSGKHFVCSNIATDPYMAPWREEALKRGYRSSAAFPLFISGKVTGTLSLYAGTPEFFNEDEIRLSLNLAADLSFAIESADLKRRSRQAEEEKNRIQAQLEHSQKMDSLGLLTGGIAHDFNNLLTVIQGYAQILHNKSDVSAADNRYLEAILKTTERAAKLTGSLLAFSRKQIFDPEQIAVNTLIKEFAGILSKLIGEEYSFTISLSPLDPHIMAQPNQIEQVLMNLVINARDAMPEGGAITVSTGVCSIDSEFIAKRGFGKSGRYAVISVTDTGIGMDAHVQKRIFDPFFTTKETGKGTGLGLSVTYGIVKQHEGFISVTSAAGKGSTFEILLPLAEPKAAAPPRKKRTAEPSDNTGTIMLAEDDEDIRELFKLVLENSGYEVITAKNGNDAIAVFGRNSDRLDLVILDVIMPEASGKHVHDEIKKIKPEIKTIFISGYTDNILTRRNIDETGAALLHKPVTPSGLTDKVKEVLSKK